MAAAFMTFWVGWGSSLQAAHFLVSLLLYDGFLTYVDVNHSALLADLAATEAERAHMSMYNSIYSTIGSLSVFGSFVLWDRSDTSSFALFCLVLAVASAVGFLVCAEILR